MCTLIIFSIIYCLTLIRFIASYQKTQEALHWWSYRQSIKLFLEAETIRDNFLQETFAIRRNLEMLSGDDWDLSAYRTQECLTKVENLHQSLAQLSERLFPVYFQDSLPLTIQGLLESWAGSHPHISFHVSLPTTWQSETIENSLIIAWSLEELLKITVPDLLTPISIYINLAKQKHKSKLAIQITYPDVSILTLYYSHLEFEFLSESFRILTSGKCLFFYKNLNIVWYFFW